MISARPWNTVPVVLAILTAATAVSCAGKKPSSSLRTQGVAETPAAGADMDGFEDAEASDIATLEQELASLESELQARGVALRGDVDRASDPKAAPASETKNFSVGDRCQRICDLRTAVCSLSERICGLAEDHAEARYQDVCARSQAHCKDATEACEDCPAPEGSAD